MKKWKKVILVVGVIALMAVSFMCGKAKGEENNEIIMSRSTVETLVQSLDYDCYKGKSKLEIRQDSDKNCVSWRMID